MPLRTVATRIFVFVAIAAVVLVAAFLPTIITAGPKNLVLALAASPSGADSLAQTRDRVLFFEHRLAHDPGDIDVLNQLSALYLQRLRESGDFADFALAKSTSRRSLAIVPAVRNAAGLAARAMAEFASHDFVAARDDARILATIDGSGLPYALLGDADSELGNYQAAENAYAQLRRVIGKTDENVASRRARMALLRGQNDDAKAALSAALAIELGRSVPSRERVAWYSWQLGDTAFFTGDYSSARARYSDALAVYPGYYRALASVGRLDAAEANYTRAKAEYEQAIGELPDPTFVAELGDVYVLAGDRTSAEREYAIVEAIGHLSAVDGAMYNRQLIMFDADHDRKTSKAYRSAQQEYAVRHDILGADALAWTALKAGKPQAANAAMREALRLGTNDPRLFYHAGMIAQALGDRSRAKAFLERALDMSPGFEPLQSTIARKALAALQRST